MANIAIKRSPKSVAIKISGNIHLRWEFVYILEFIVKEFINGDSNDRIAN